jgi:hypothetical protein
MRSGRPPHARHAEGVGSPSPSKAVLGCRRAKSRRGASKPPRGKLEGRVATRNDGGSAAIAKRLPRRESGMQVQDESTSRSEVRGRGGRSDSGAARRALFGIGEAGDDLSWGAAGGAATRREGVQGGGRQKRGLPRLRQRDPLPRRGRSAARWRVSWVKAGVGRPPAPPRR